LTDVAWFLDSLGRTGHALGEYDRALAMLRRLYGGEDRPDVAQCLNGVAVCQAGLGNFDRALPLFRECLAMRRRLYGRDQHPLVMLALHNTAHCLLGHGHAAEALRVLERVRKLQYEFYGHGAKNPHIAATLGLIASCRAELGLYPEALAAARDTLKLTEALHDRAHPDVARALHRVAVCLAALGRHEEARSNLETACLTAEKCGSAEGYKFACDLGMLLLHRLDKPEQAVAAFDTAIAGMETARGQVGGTDMERATFFAFAVSRWGAFDGMLQGQLRLGRPDKALEYLERGRATGLRDVLERRKHVGQGGLADLVIENAQKAGNQALEAVARKAREAERRAAGEIAVVSAEISLLAGRTDLPDTLRRGAIGECLEQLARARAAHAAARRDLFNLAAAEMPGGRGLRALNAGEIRSLLRAEDRMLVYHVAERGAFLLFVAPPGQVHGVRAFPLTWPTGPGWTGPPDEVDEESLADAVDLYLSSLRAERSASRHEQAGVVTSVAGGRSADARRGGITRPRAVRSPLGKQAMLAHRLFRALVPAEVWAELPSADLVYVVPDGILHRLPFEALVVEEPHFGAGPVRGCRYWLDAGPPLVYGPSATVLAERREVRTRQIQYPDRHQPRREAALLGDPVFEREPEFRPALLGSDMAANQAAPGRARGGLGFQSGVGVPRHLTRYAPLRALPGTRKEVEEIYEGLTGRRHGNDSPDEEIAVLLGEDATRARLFEMAQGSRYVHLATHGLSELSDQAIYSRLALTRPQPGVDSPDEFGYLTLDDLLQHWGGRLAMTELVVLSACDTQRGRIIPGEGVFGLPWGFMYAGSPAVIASLWPVADDTTAEMMGNLYARIRAIPRGVAEPEPNAKLLAFVEVRQALRTRHPEPCYWAPFIYLGDPR
jgi:tetratricopeptide (TPR) repeat protein